MAQNAWAGHAGDMGSSFLMPHELMGGFLFLGILGLVLVLLLGVALRALFRIERRLQKLEQRLGEHPNSPTPPPRSRSDA